jgi:predicted deacylase
MPLPIPRRSIAEWGTETIPPGAERRIHLEFAESYTGMTNRIPVFVKRGTEDGPVLFVTAALHGDEINGTGAVRTLIQDPSLKLTRGAIILVPVVNILGFDRHARYLPDRRDLNRCFPGSLNGSIASRLARTIYDEIVSRCDYGIDLHTAAVRRTNFPNIRGDLLNPEVARIAAAFGLVFVIDGKGPKGSLRRVASRQGCPTVLLEGGEVWKVEPTVVEAAVRGIHNVLANLGMIDSPPQPPPLQCIIRRTKWVRAGRGGFLDFHVAPGSIVVAGQPLATQTELLGTQHAVLESPFNGVVIGMTTLPAVSPGEAVFHIGEITDDFERALQLRVVLSQQTLHERVRDDLASNVLVVEHTSPRVEVGEKSL